MMAGASAGIDDLLATVEEAAARFGGEPGTPVAAVRAFLAGPPVVRVVGPPHPERGAVAGWLAAALPAVTVLEAAPVGPDPAPLWDVSVIVTPADRALSLAEERYLRAAAQGRRPLLVLVSRISVWGDEAAQATARGDLESLRLVPVLRARDIPWFYLAGSVPGAADAGIAQRVAAMAQRESGHQRAVRAYLRAQADELIGRAASLVDARHADQAALAALRARLSAQRGSLREAARTSVLAGLDRLRAAEDDVYRSVDEVAGLARAWLDSDALLPWPDVEYPVKRSLARLDAEAGRLGADFAAALLGDLGRVGHMLGNGLAELGLRARKRAEPAVSLADPDLARAVARLRKADLAPALAAAEQVLRDHLDAVRAASAASDDGARDDGTAKAGKADKAAKKDKNEEKDEEGQEDADSLHSRIGDAVDRFRSAIDSVTLSLPDAAPDDDAACHEARGILVQFLDAYLRPRVREITRLAEDAFTRAGQAALDDAMAGFERELDRAEAELGVRHAWSAVYARLVALRDEIG